MKGDKKPIAFVEDTAVHPKHLAEFVPRVRDVFAKHDAVGAYYGHCSVGCLRSEEHTSELQSLAYLVCRLLLEKKKLILRSSLKVSTVSFCDNNIFRAARNSPHLPEIFLSDANERVI